MKLVRYGAPGAELPGTIDVQGTHVVCARVLINTHESGWRCGRLAVYRRGN
jgi:hypothetical protein